MFLWRWVYCSLKGDAGLSRVLQSLVQILVFKSPFFMPLSSKPLMNYKSSDTSFVCGVTLISRGGFSAWTRRIWCLLLITWELSTQVLPVSSRVPALLFCWLVRPFFNYKAKSRLKDFLVASPVFLFMSLLPASRMHSWNRSASSSLCWERQASYWYSSSIMCPEFITGLKQEFSGRDPATEYTDPCLLIPIASAPWCLHKKHNSTWASPSAMQLCY